MRRGEILPDGFRILKCIHCEKIWYEYCYKGTMSFKCPKCKKYSRLDNMVEKYGRKNANS